ncbi:ribonuclease [Aureimonas sp. Leaf454]|uniref:ribonuclease E/G n=1 Tax=Aureimonas sp. Leaf454 TaxID=1736381 RepID=UPI0006FC7CA3|nr:ribonuclease E/G [Aureimonas sp. Leaf454]KQT48814.1 ribonuclease [Aureimonas sp. Leaf454]
MANKMLIDASHPEETRVVVVRGSRIEEFDFESEHKKQIKGNIYLAKVTRVEPSLQAAFVEYGGNRHGFLAFSEIHPDYYQIPQADRQALMEDELARAQEEEEAEDRKARDRSRRESLSRARGSNGDSVSEDAASEGEGDAGQDGDDLSENEHEAPELISDDSGHGEDAGTDEASDGDSDRDDEGVTEINGDGESNSESPSGRRRGGRRSRSRGRSSSGSNEDEAKDGDEAEEVDQLGAEDAMEEVPVRQPRAPRKQYKIQEVIKRRQILLVQVVKEERGNKGAALTTYLSLAGRYSVLMPNTARGGGISRKITNVADRKRLKEVAKELEVPRGMGIILRTAGAMRTKAEVKRDYEYLMRLWETVRSLTLSSTAPTLVYEEGSLIKRSIRDLYNKDIDQVLVAGENGYREAKDFMRMLMPSQSKVVQPYRDPVPIFARGGIEAQLDKMLQPHVTLKSGGYIIINQTEALVAIDVNSGRSTREHSVEDTAFQTNMEAAEEVARQLRLRDLAGLIVIDFIDMDEKRNNRAVEKKVKECLKDDRARIQVGRISHFGLMEMSRQRIRASVLESTTQPCPVCDGVGHIRSNSSLALHVVRAVEEHLQKQDTHDLVVKVPTATALYVLNEKRARIEELERHHGVRIIVQADDSHGHQHCAIEHGAEAVRREPRLEVVNPLSIMVDEIDEDEIEDAEVEDVVAAETVEADAETASSDESSEDRNRRKRRRRRRRGGSDSADAGETESGDVEASGDDRLDVIGADAADEIGGEEQGETMSAEDAAADEESRNRKRRRRGRRGGRKTREGEESDGTAEGSEDEMSADAVSSDVIAEAREDAADGVDDIAAPEAHRGEEPGDVSSDEGAALANVLVAGIVSEPVAETVADDVAADEAEAAAVDDVTDLQPAPATAQSAVEEPEATEELSVPEAVPHEETATVAEASVESVEPAVEAAAEAPAPVLPREPQLTTSDGEVEETKPKRTGWWAKKSFF